MSTAGRDPDISYAVELMMEWDPAEFRMVRDDSGGITVIGPCPKCGHDIDKEFQATGIFAFRDEDRGEGPEQDVIRCNCVHVHDGGAAGQGCGRYWGVEVKIADG